MEFEVQRSLYERRSLVQVELAFLIRPIGALRSMATISLSTLATGLETGLTPITDTSFFLYSHLQVPQSNFCPVPATCLLENLSQATLNRLLCDLDILRYFCIRASLDNQCCDRPLFTRKIQVPVQQRHGYHPIDSNLATCVTPGAISPPERPG